MTLPATAIGQTASTLLLGQSDISVGTRALDHRDTADLQSDSVSAGAAVVYVYAVQDPDLSAGRIFAAGPL